MHIHTHTETRPDELSVVVIDGRIVDAAWTVSSTSKDGGWDNEVFNVGNVSIPASYDEATRLLMKCRYPRPDKECVIMRKPTDDPERVEHEAFYERVSEYVATLGLDKCGSRQ